MATTFFLPSSGACAASPAYSTYSDNTQGDRIEMTLTRGATALTNKAVTEAESGDVTTVLVRQYVSPPLNAYSFQAGVDTWEWTFRAKEDNATDDAQAYLTLKIWNAVTQAYTGTLYAGTPSANELTVGTLTSYGRATRAMSGSYALNDGDRVVFEIATLFTSPGAAAVSTYDFGEGGAAALDISFTDTGADWPHLGFSATLSSYSGEATNIVMNII